MVQMFSGEGLMDLGAMDKYERNRVGRALAAMVQEGIISQEDAVEVARNQEGAIWDEAVTRATKIRAPGQIMSFLGGVGMKARTEEDRITDQFYQEYYRLQNLNEADLINPKDYQQAWDGLRTKYPFMDSLLLSRKAGVDRDKAYAYNVLGRVPPGQAKDIYKAVGIDPAIAQKFFDTKGNIKDWSQSDRDKFMSSMIDLGAMLAIPDSATKQDWNTARDLYKGVQEDMKENFGANIQDTLDEYYSIDDSNKRKDYMAAHPEIQQALSFQNERIVNTPDLYAFYGGIQTIEKYHKGLVYDQLEQTFGADIQDKLDTYNEMKLTDPKGASKYYKQHPELKRYSQEKKVLMAQALQNIVAFAARLPEEEKPELTGNEPESVGQQNLQDYAQQTAPTFAEFQQSLPLETQLIQSYWNESGQIPYEVTKALDYKAYQLGYDDGESLLQAILVSLERGQ
jgi:hypothetical protein